MSFLSFLDDANNMCFSSARFSNPSAEGSFSNGTFFQIGNVESCLNGTRSTLCNTSLTVNDAELVCRSIGGANVAHTTAIFGSQADFRPILRRRGFYDITCPSQRTQFSNEDCNYTATTNGCVSEGGAALISCVTGESWVPQIMIASS